MQRRTFIKLALSVPALISPGAALAESADLEELLQLATHRNGTGSPEHFGREHAFMFDPNSPSRLAAMPECKVIKVHGRSEISPSGWVRYEFPNSRWPLFVNPSVGVSSLRKAEIGGIVSGQLRNWSQLGGPDLNITVIMNWGVALKGLYAMLHENGIPLSQVAARDDLVNCNAALAGGDAIGFKSCGGYVRMLQMGQQTPGALVLGLRSVKPEGLLPLSIEGEPFSLENNTDYPLQRGFAVLVREGDRAAEEDFKSYLVQLIQRKNADISSGYDKVGNITS